MLFGKKEKKKHFLPFEAEKEEEVEKKASGQAYDPRAERYAQPQEEDGELKNYAIYYRDRELANLKGDPMLTIVQAYSQNEAELEAGRMQKEGCEILAVRSRQSVEFPTHDSDFVFPQDRTSSRDRSNGAEILGRKRRHFSD